MRKLTMNALGEEKPRAQSGATGPRLGIPLSEAFASSFPCHWTSISHQESPLRAQQAGRSGGVQM